MKSIFSALLICGAMGMSGAAFAAAEAGTLNSGNTIGPTGDSAATHTCSLLGSQVQINLSNNVEAAFSCNFASSTIRTGTCHVAGSRAPRTVTCASTPVVDDDGQPTGAVTWNAAGCGPDVPTVTVTDRAAFTASSQGGSVSVTDLQGATCSDDSVAALIAQ